jgi:hypothetical protein
MVKAKNMRKLVSGLAILVLSAMLLTSSSGSHPFIENYRAKLSIEGTATLRSFLNGTETPLHIESNFTAIIPKPIEPGNYANAAFQGIASVSEDSTVEFAGVIKIMGLAFAVKFDVEAGSTGDLSEHRYEANGILNVTITELPHDFPGISVYPARINATGDLTLKSYTKDITASIPIETNFTTAVPTAIKPGTHDATFLGTAIVSDDVIKFGGIMNAGGYNFWVRFDVKKTESSPPEGVYSANGTMQVTITEIPFEELGVTWIMMRGAITQYGDEKAFGRLIAHGKIGQWFNAFGGLFIRQEPSTMQPTESATVSFCQFKMKNYTSVELDYEGNDLYVKGLWNVYNITFTYFDDELTYNRTLIVDGGYGELNVTLGDQRNFTLAIDGIQEISGDVIFYHVKYCKPFDHGPYRFGVPITDLNGDWKVNILDLMRVARSYGSMAGKPNYSFDFDFNLDLAVNIYDLYDIAKDYGQEY